MFRRKREDEERKRELEHYLARETEENLARGMAPEEAWRVAHVKLGNARRIREEIYEMNGIGFLETLWQDIRYAARMLRKSPGFTTAAVFTLALGIGANTAMFSVVDAVLLKPLHYKAPDSIAILWEKLPKYQIRRNTVWPINFLAWQEQNRAFAGMAAFLDQPLNLTGNGEPEQLSAEYVSPNFFSLLGVKPILGRGFDPEESQQGKNDVVVLSYGLWKSRYDGDPNIVGKMIELNGTNNTVVGIAPADFDWYIREFSITGRSPVIWTPLVVTPGWRDPTRLGRFLRVVARVKPGVSLAQAQAQMDTIAAGLAARYPQMDKGWGVNVVSLRDELSGAIRPALLILLGAVGLVLLIACTNISGLLLSQAAGRSHEMAIRTALGATRKRIVRQLLTESMMLSAIGGILGIFVAVWTTEALASAAPAGLLDFTGISIDWRVVAACIVLTLVAGILGGGVPSVMAARSALACAVSEGGRRSSAGRNSLAVRSGLIVAEIGLALVLLAGSSLLIQSFIRLVNVDPGFSASHLLTFQVSLPAAKYKPEARAAFFSQLLDKVRALPGVVSASADVTPPFSGVGSATDFAIVGEPPLPPGEAYGTGVRVIEPDYFRTMGIPLLRGRLFEAREFAQQSNVVIVNETFSDRYFHGKNPLGQKVVIDMKDQNLPDEIIGVVGDTHESSLATSPEPEAYWPFPELTYPVMTAIARTATPPLSLVPAVRGAVRQIDEDQPIAKVSTMDQLVANSVARSRFMMMLLAMFAAAALGLACIGVYGVMAYAVTQRMHEIGIRIALGAQRRDVMRLVLVQGTRLTLFGVGIGVLAALGLTRLMSGLLYSVSASDPLTFAGVATLLALIVLAACYVPARRAMRVDPMVALRNE
jgi:putative ABC transport system permease protein